MDDLMSHATVDPNFRPKVSAIVSVFKAERSLQGCLEDLVEQSLFRQEELEVVVVDSDSPEREGDIVKPFLQRYPRQIQYLRTHCRETSCGAWNRGIRAARGRYISNANADDRHSPDGLERLAQVLDAHLEVALVYGDDDVTRLENSTFATAPRAARFAWPAFEPRHLFEICYLGPHPMWRKELHEKHGWFDPGFRLAGDYDFWLRLAAAGEVFLHLPTIVGLHLQAPEEVEIGNQELSLAESHLARVRNWPKAWGRRPDPRGNYLFPMPSPVPRQADPNPTGQAEPMLERLLRTCRERPLDPGPYADLALHFASLGQADKGITLMEQALGTFPGAPVILRTLEELRGPAPGSLRAPDGSARGTVLFVNTCYPAFLEAHYARSRHLLQADYGTQRDALLQSYFGDSDFYSRGISLQGWDAGDLIPNCEPLQAAWRRENDFSGDALATLVEQIRRTRPDVVYLQNLALGQKAFLDQIRPFTRLIAGQIASPIPDATHLPGFDLLFSSFPHFVERFRQQGLCAYYQPLAFDPRVLGRLGPRQPTLPFTFVGGISPDHAAGTALLESIAKGTPLQLWGYGADSLPATSVLKERHRGEAWALDMFGLLRASAITLNRHIDTADRFANNMRLFEATGCGALLVTDHKDNLQELFRIGEEVVAYRSPGEAVDLVTYYLLHPEEAEAIARAGQARTLKDHTYAKRMEQTAEILERHLRYRSGQDRLPALDISAISYGHTPIEPAAVGPELLNAWQDPSIPGKQRTLVQEELAQLYRGNAPVIFQVLADLVGPALDAAGQVLEIGCASGYYYEILEYLLGRRLDYTGVDYSAPLVAMARDYYPRARFEVADGSALPFDDNRFSCVISSCILLHVPNFEDHIRETVRVAGSWVVAHRTPICRSRPTQLFRKFAYGVETVELRFNEKELLETFARHGARLQKAVQYFADPGADTYEGSYLFRVTPPGVPPPGPERLA